MQQSSCEDIHLLISRYVDDEVSIEERELVEAHVAVCEPCAYRLLEYMEMAAIFAESPMRQPAPDLRAGLFREINSIKEDARRKVERVETGSKVWRAPQDEPLFPRSAPVPVHVPVRLPQRILRIASPVLAAVVPVFVLLGALILGSGLFRQGAVQDPVTQAEVAIGPIPTSDMPLNGDSLPDIPPVETRGPGVAMPSPEASTTTYMSATATLGPYTLIDLRQPTPVWEEGDPNGSANWHSVRDPQYGYKVAYPANWWTRTLKNTRYFYPWNGGGTMYAPYWIELSVQANEQGLTAETGNEEVCGGRCVAAVTSDGSLGWLHRTGSDDRNSYHDGFLFDSQYIYHLRLNVPLEGQASALGYSERSAEGESIFGLMSGRIALAGDLPASESAFGGMLFLGGSDPERGSDLYKTMTSGEGTRRLTWNGGVKSFALSPDMDRVVYAVTDKERARDPWARYIYLATLSGTAQTQTLLVAGMNSIHDVAWYSDREVVFLAERTAGSLGLYKLSVPTGPARSDSVEAAEPELLVELGYEMVGARSLAVAPDRQLITFMAPLGENKNTDIYGVRPDGSDLRVIISHADPVAPMKDGSPVLADSSQAIKSYQWMDGHLEQGGYAANILFICGSSYSPNVVLGGALYSAPRGALSPLVSPFDLVNYQPERLQITHIAYSAWGKIAFTGYYNDFANRADKLEGLWIADTSSGSLENVTRLPIPQEYNGITDLQWSPDGNSLFYRETIKSEWTARYKDEPTFRIVKLDLASRITTILHDMTR